MNRRLLKEHDPHGTDVLLHKVRNPYDEKRYIYFFSDPPHLIKTVLGIFEQESVDQSIINI